MEGTPLAMFPLKSILRQKRNYENSKYFTMQKNNFQKKKKKHLKETKILQGIIITL
jgi:hypothetical protein